MFSIFFEKYAKICRFAPSFNHNSAADYIYSLFLHVIMAQGGLSVADGCRCLTKELDMIAC